ncbi:RHS repeat-associated core domain-containing protein, partial [Pseudomonas indica]|uniref:RHS repeat-associated core domain-containing protein n=1 Tax=Pseudomonas indica TaxID=137658 RepID=UPI0023F9901E
AFGVGPANPDVDGDGLTTDIPLRFPGQLYDAHSALHYNYFRDYDPETGRYVESDPIGLKGGLNTYGYVLGNPLKYSDPKGLNPVALCFIPGIGWTTCAAIAEAAVSACAYVGTAVGGALLGGYLGDKLFNESRPREGEPNSDYWPGEREDGSTGDGRRFGSDGKPEVDYDHGHGNHVGPDGEPLGDHAHNWDKQPDGSIRRGPPCRYCQIK